MEKCKVGALETVQTLTQQVKRCQVPTQPTWERHTRNLDPILTG